MIETLDRKNVDGQFAAQYFKYRLQFKFSYIVDKVDFRRIAAKSLYHQYQREFDSLVSIFKKHDLDVLAYIKFFVGEYGMLIKDIKGKLLSMDSIKAFVESLQILEQKKKIYKWFVRSSETIAQDCIDLGYQSSRDYLVDIIKQGKLASYYLTGKISKYWLVGIPTFKQIISKLDQLSQDEFRDIYKRFDVYNTEINEAFIQETGHKSNPIRYTDDLIQAMRVDFQQSK